MFERTSYLSLHGGALEYTVQKLERMGWNGRFDGDMAITPPEGTGFEFECRHDTFNGKPVERWEMAGYGGGGNGLDITPLDVGQIDRLNALYAQMKGTQVASTATPAAAPVATPDAVPAQAAPASPAAPGGPGSAPGAAGTIPDSDIPF